MYGTVKEAERKDTADRLRALLHLGPVYGLLACAYGVILTAVGVVMDALRPRVSIDLSFCSVCAIKIK